MKTTDRFERIEATIEKLAVANSATQSNLDRLAQVTSTIADSVVAHDDEIDKLVTVAKIQQQKWEQLRREWQAYLTTIHPRQ